MANAVRSLSLRIEVLAPNGQTIIKNVTLGINQMRGAAQAATPAVQRLNQAVISKANNFRLASASSNVLVSSMTNLHRMVNSLGFAFGAFGALNLFKNIIGQAIEFDAKMADLSSVVTDNTVNMSHLRQQIVALDGSLGSSAQQAHAMYEALSSGIEASHAVDFVATSSKLATAILADQADATKLLLTIMNAYGMEVQNITHVSDVMAETIRVGILRGHELTGALGTVINTAAAAGVSFEEVSASIAVMTRVGIDAHEATTALNQALLTFLDPTDQAREAAAALGIELSGNALRTKTWQVALRELALAVEGNRDLTTQFFTNVRALKAVLALTGAQAQDFNQILNRMNHEIDGLTDVMFAKQMQSFERQFEAAKNNVIKSLDAITATMLSDVLPAINDGSKYATEFFVNLGKLGTIQAVLEGLLRPMREFIDLLGSENASDFAKQIDGAARTLLFFINTIDASRQATLNFFRLAFAAARGDLVEIQRLSEEIHKQNTKFFQGTQGKQAPGFGDLLKEDAAILSSQITILEKQEEKSRKLHETIDRLNSGWVDAGGGAKVFKEEAETLNETLTRLNNQALSKTAPLTEQIAEAWDKLAAAKKRGDPQAEIEKLERAYVTLKARGIDEASRSSARFAKEQDKVNAELLEFRQNALAAGRAIDEVIKLEAQPILSRVDQIRADWERSNREFFDAIRLLQQGVLVDDLDRILNERRDLIQEANDTYLEIMENWGERARELSERSFVGEVDKSMARIRQQVDDMIKKSNAWKVALQGVFDILAQIGNGRIFGDIAQSLAAGVRAYLAVIQEIKEGRRFNLTTGKFENTATDIFGKTLTKANAFAAAFASVFAQLADRIGGLTGRILGYISNLAAGFATGNWIGLAVAGIGVLIDIFTSLDDKINDVQNSARMFGHEISEALAEELYNSAQKAGWAIENEILTNLDKIAAETGITAKNLNWFIYSFNTAISTFAAGTEAAKKVLQDLNSLLPQMLEAGTDSFGRLNRQMLEFIDRLQAAGIEVKALRDWFVEQGSAASTALTSMIESFGQQVTEFSAGVTNNIKKMIEGSLPEAQREEALSFLDKLIEKNLSLQEVISRMQTKFPGLEIGGLLQEPGFLKELLTNRAEFTDFFTLIMAQINRMQAAGIDLVTIFQQLGPAMNTLKDAAVELGLRSDPAFRSFFQLFKIMNTGAAESLSNINNLLVSFSNMGILTQKTFSALENQFSKVFKKFNEDGKISRAEMTAMVPTLAELRYMSERYGFALDKTTEKLIKQAIESGHLSKEIPIDPMDRLTDVIENKLIPAIDKMIERMSAAMGFDGSTINMGVNVAYTTTGTPPPGVLPPPPRPKLHHSTIGHFTAPYDDYIASLRKGQTISSDGSTTARSSSGTIKVEAPVVFKHQRTGQVLLEDIIDITILNNTAIAVKRGRES